MNAVAEPVRPARRRKGVAQPEVRGRALHVARRPRATPKPPPPFLLDFYPQESESQTRLHRFYESLREGRLTTTRCAKHSTWFWPPRVVCPRCHDANLEWVDLPTRGRVYAFSAVLAGAPLGMEADVPYVVGLVDLEGIPLRLFGRIVGRPWTECRVGQRVRVEPYTLDDGRAFYEFRVDDDPSAGE